MSEEKAVWYTIGDTGKCKACGDDAVFSGKYWEHVNISPRHPVDIIPDSVTRKTAVCCGGCDKPHIKYSAWLKIMIADGWREGSAACGWVQNHNGKIATMTQDEAMAFFAAGLTPPPMDWELPFSEPVGGSDGPQKPL